MYYRMQLYSYKWVDISILEQVVQSVGRSMRGWRGQAGPLGKAGA